MQDFANVVGAVANRSRRITYDMLLVCTRVWQKGSAVVVLLASCPALVYKSCQAKCVAIEHVANCLVSRQPSVAHKCSTAKCAPKWPLRYRHHKWQPIRVNQNYCVCPLDTTFSARVVSGFALLPHQGSAQAPFFKQYWWSWLQHRYISVAGRVKHVVHSTKSGSCLVGKSLGHK